MTLRTRIVVNQDHACFLWPGPRESSLPALCKARFSATSALIYLLGTRWQGHRVCITGPRDGSEEIQGQPPVLPGLQRSQESIRAVREAAFQHAQGLSHRERIPHMVVNYDLGQRLDPGELGDGTTLGQMATGGVGGTCGGTQTALTFLLAQGPHRDSSCGDLPTTSPLSGSWAGHRIAVLPVNSPQAPWSTESITAEVGQALQSAGLGSYSVTTA